jgi:hypothetical protein
LTSFVHSTVPLDGGEGSPRRLHLLCGHVCSCDGSLEASELNLLVPLLVAGLQPLVKLLMDFNPLFLGGEMTCISNTAIIFMLNVQHHSGNSVILLSHLSNMGVKMSSSEA